METPKVKLLNQETPEKPQEEPQSSQESSEEVKSQGTQTTSTDQQGDQSTKKQERIIAAQQSVINDYAAKFESLEKKIEAMTKPPEPTSQEKDAKFWSNPTQVLQEQLRQTVEPLVEFKNEYTRAQKLAQIKNQLRQDPQFASVLERAENLVDQLMTGQEPTLASVRAAIYGVRGAAEMGAIEGLSFAEQGQRAMAQQNAPINPPHVRPSAPNTPSQKRAAPTEPNLTENERRLAREYGMTPVEYVDWRDNESTKVDDWKELGKEKK
jgi:hypothetical protein